MNEHAQKFIYLENRVYFQIKLISNVFERNIFIIHSEKDNNILRLLIAEFNEQEYYMDEIINKLVFKYLDSNDAKHFGQDFGEVIKEYINNSDKIIIIISESIFNSIWVNQEIGYTVCSKDPQDYKCIIDRKYAGCGFGFIHSNIDVQLIDYGDARFNKIDQYFQSEYGIKIPSRILTPIKENEEIGVEPYVV